jgi:rhodanese-related sulfurtransferase
MQAIELLQRIKLNRAPMVIDTRTTMEFKRGHIPGAINAPVLKLFFKRVRLPEDRNLELVITCEHGPRARMAKGLLDLRGYGNTTLLEGYLEGWKKAGLPLEK